LLPLPVGERVEVRGLMLPLWPDEPNGFNFSVAWILSILKIVMNGSLR
jgi:hypothetical protein